MPGEYITIRFGDILKIDRCVICESALTNEFPKDFPDEFKMCCYCLNFASIMSHGNRQVIIEHYSILQGGNMGRLKDLLDKIEKHITLVG